MNIREKSGSPQAKHLPVFLADLGLAALMLVTGFITIKLTTSHFIFLPQAKSGLLAKLNWAVLGNALWALYFIPALTGLFFSFTGSPRAQKWLRTAAVVSLILIFFCGFLQTFGRVPSLTNITAFLTVRLEELLNIKNSSSINIMFIVRELLWLSLAGANAFWVVVCFRSATDRPKLTEIAFILLGVVLIMAVYNGWTGGLKIAHRLADQPAPHSLRNMETLFLITLMTSPSGFLSVLRAGSAVCALLSLKDEINSRQSPAPLFLLGVFILSALSLVCAMPRYENLSEYLGRGYHLAELGPQGFYALSSLFFLAFILIRRKRAVTISTLPGPVLGKSFSLRATGRSDVQLRRR